MTKFLAFYYHCVLKYGDKISVNKKKKIGICICYQFENLKKDLLY